MRQSLFDTPVIGTFKILNQRLVVHGALETTCHVLLQALGLRCIIWGQVTALREVFIPNPTRLIVHLRSLCEGLRRRTDDNHRQRELSEPLPKLVAERTAKRKTGERIGAYRAANDQGRAAVMDELDRFDRLRGTLGTAPDAKL